MPKNKIFTDNDYIDFERDLLAVLKDDKDHKINFDGKLLIHSSRYNCNIAATDVHWDKDKGDIVLVGAFKSGDPVMDSTVRYPKMLQRVSLPLKECYNDLKNTSGMQTRLVSKARKGVIDKYISCLLNSFENRYLLNNGLLDLTSLEMGHFKLKYNEVLAISRDENGYINLLVDNDNNNFGMKISQIKLKEVQHLGCQLSSIQEAISKGIEIFTEKMKSMEPTNMTRNDKEHDEHITAALIAVYDAKLPMKLCNSIAKFMADSDFFDETKQTRKQILANIKNIKNKKPENGIRTRYINKI